MHDYFDKNQILWHLHYLKW